MTRIDAHHHLWHYNTEEFDWLEGPLSALRRDFLVPDLLSALSSANVDGALAVQARQSIAETNWLLETAASTPAILGVVGWLPIASPDFADYLQPRPLLKGLRHVVQAEAPGFLDAEAFNQGIARLKDTGLVYDILIHQAQLEEAIRFVDRHPHQPFVLDHIAKPRIAVGELEPWATHIRSLAQRPNVACKLSSMVTEADPLRWSVPQLQPFFDVVLEAFTPSRLMIGTDWPVLTAGCTYGQWWHIVEHWTATLSTSEKADILGATARRTYHL